MNPILEMTSDPHDPIPLVELKQHLVFFVHDPPGPQSAKRVYEAYLHRCGDNFTKYRSTFPCASLDEWTPDTRRIFEQKLLPGIRTNAHWGYGLSDDKPKDSWLFMVHGFRPFQQPHMASFYRFEFDWQVDAEFLRTFAEEISSLVPFFSGYGGYFLQGRPTSNHGLQSWNRSFAWAMRYWGCEVADVEATAAQMRTGYKYVNWLTLIGEPFCSRFPSELERAKSVACDHTVGKFETLLQATERPLLGDRNRAQNMDGYSEIARALLPLQITEHQSFGGDLWTEENTQSWLRRFTHKEA